MLVVPRVSVLFHCLFLSVDCTYDGVTHYAGESFAAGDGCNEWLERLAIFMYHVQYVNPLSPSCFPPSLSPSF